MRDFQTKSKKNNSKAVILFFCVIILLFTSVELVKEIINKRELQKNINELSVKVNDLKKRNTDLSSMISYFQSLDFVEQEARTKLNFRKPGENIIIVAGSVENRDGDVVSNGEINLNSEANQLINSKTNPQKWLDYFFANN